MPALPPNNRVVRLKPLSAGVRVDRHPTLLLDGETPFSTNVEFSSESIRSSRGSRKLGNQALPRPSVRCRPDAGYAPLSIEAGKSVPLRGYIYWPYDEKLDLGGDFASAGAFPALTYHNRRGRSFELQATVRIPETFRMHDRPARGEGAPTSGNAAVEAGAGYDEGLDDCTLILQKGGDRNTPMSWALGIVNAGNWQYNTDGPSLSARKSNYFLVFMWLDSAEWAATDNAQMRYSLSDPSAGSSGSYSTQALRAIILDGKDDANVAYALEPGKSYNVSVAVTLDSAAITAGAWAGDGRFDFRVQEQFGRFWSGSWAGGTLTNLSIFKGPLDSAEYLAKYGIRYSGKDAQHVGLGFRMGPWQEQGWIPFGFDSAAMEHKGFRMADASLNSIDDLYGPGAYTLVCSHVAGADAYVRIDGNQSLTVANANLSQSPLGTLGALWSGYGRTTGAFNTDALRGYRLVIPRSSVTGFQGARFNIQGYTEVAGPQYRIALKDVGSTATTWTNQPFLIQAFRWNQQEIDVQEVRVWKTSRDYSDPRVIYSMCSELALDDETEPQLEKLQGYLPLNDGEGRVCKELVRGRDAFFAPFGLGLTKQGTEGTNALFLSGEGEALVYDLSENPVFVREMRALLQSNSRGFAIEVSCIMPEAYYGVARLTQREGSASAYEAAYCPDLVAWSVKDADEAGARAAPLLVMGHHSWWSSGTGTTPERKPQGFHVDVHTGLDGEAAGMTTAVLGHTTGGNWDTTAPWVGKRITLQVGVQPSPANRAGTANKGNEYRVYIAATPKGVLKYAAGENPQAEFAYYSDQIVQKKDLLRLVVTIGGGWNPSMARGYTELSARMIVDKVRIYGATAAGALPTSTGLVTAERRGKVLGRNALPQRLLTEEDIVQPLGVGTRTARLVEGSATVEAPGGTSFYTQLPEDSKESVRERFLVATADKFRLPAIDDIDTFIQEFYWISSVAADGSTLTLATPYAAPDSAAGGVGQTNLIGYTVFAGTEQDILRAPLSLGAGQPYQPGVTETKDLVLSPPLFKNVGPVDGQWKVRIASPFTQGGLATVLPRWTRGIVAPRRNGITGVQALDDTVFATNRGSIFKVDDRWRDDGPTRTLRRSLEIRGRSFPGHETRWPLATDGVRFSVYSNSWAPYTGAAGFTWVHDFWVKIEEYAEYQSMSWLGCEYAHMLRGAAATNDQRGIGLWFRLADGRPEVVRQGANNAFGVGAPPPDGRYVASSAERIPLGRWTHIRFWIPYYNDGVNNVLALPGVSINGRATTVSVNAQDTVAQPSGGWMQLNSGGGLIGSSGDARNVLYLGTARDTVRTYSKSQFTALSQLGGREFPGSRIAGQMHPLLGRMAGVVTWRAASSDASVLGFPDFDPNTLNYSAAAVRFRADLQEGIGELAADTATEVLQAVVPGVILSHPGIDLFNEFGDREQLPSFALIGKRLFATNGGRVAYVEDERGGPAGIVPPSSAPTVRLERKPLWAPNVNLVDPVAAAAVGAGEQIYHYSSHGNNWLFQAFHADMMWQKDDAGSTFDVLAVKFYWKPRDVAGRIPLWTARRSTDSGGVALECVDGKLELSWYDTALKKRVPITTSARVFRPGRWHYVNLRKAFPQQDLSEGNWLNTFYARGDRRKATFTIGVAGWAVGDIVLGGGTKRGLVTKVHAGVLEWIQFHTSTEFASGDAVTQSGGAATGTITQTPYQFTGDALIVREFAETTTFADLSAWASTPAAERASVSFTSELPMAANLTAVGPVTPKGILWSGGAAGLVTVGTMAGVAQPTWVVTQDMIGMYCQLDTGTPGVPSKVYRINIYGSPTQFNVVDEHGVAPNLGGIVNVGGAIFSGVELVKGEDFDLSNAPDQAAYAIEFMGSALATNSNTGLMPQSGEFASFAWTVQQSTLAAFYSAVHVFETGSGVNDFSQIGTDQFLFDIFDPAGRPGELKADTGATFMCVDTRPYAGATADSTQPNSSLEVAKDTEASANAESCFWKSAQSQEVTAGRRIINVIFFDLDQNVPSNPSPRAVFEVTEEDKSNPSGHTRLVLEGLPISHQPGRIQRRVFITDPDSLQPFRAAIIPDNYAGSIALALDDSELIRNDPLLYDHADPPSCSVIGYSQERLWFADIELAGIRQRDLVRFSQGLLVTQVPLLNQFALVSGPGEQIVGMAESNGALILWKRNSMSEIKLRDGQVVQTEKSRNVGLVGPQAFADLDQELYWFSSDRGLYYYPGAGGPLWLGEALIDIVEGSHESLNVDRAQLERVVLAINRAQDQVVGLFQALEEPDMRRRFTVDYDDALSGYGVPHDPANGFRYALYAGPNLTAIGAADRLGAGPRRLLGGTAEGYVAEIDRQDEQLELASPFWPSTVTLAAGSTTMKLVLASANALLAQLDGVRGVPLAWIESGVEHRATALFSDGSSIWLDRALDVAPGTGVVVSLGAIALEWRSKWFDFENEHERKVPEYLDLVIRAQAGGQAVVQVYKDFEEVPQQIRPGGVEGAFYTMDLTQPLHRVPLSEVRGQFLQARILTVTPAVGVRLEVLSMTWRLQDGEMH